MKKRYKQKRSFSSLSSILIVVLICALSIGYSAFRTTLDLNKLAAEVRVEADIRVTGISPYGNSGAAISNWEDYNVNSISSQVFLPNEDSSITYKIDVTNFGNVEMGILQITGLPDNLEYQLEGYTIKDKICVNGQCKLGITKEFYLTIRYKENQFSSDTTDYNINMTFDFKSFHHITYTDFTIDTNQYPQEIISGDTLTVTLDPSIKGTNLSVYQENNSVPFQYENNTLIVENVTGDLEIKYQSDNEKNEIYQLLESESKGTDKNIDFKDPNLDNGVFMHEETKNDPYPIYYYRGMVENNNMIYSGHCFRIVRTTEYGGIKIVYDGEPSGNTCPHSHNRLGSEPYNGTKEENASPSEVGYMYGLDINYEEIKPKIEVNFMFGNDVVYDDATKQYKLVSTIVNTDLNQLEDDIRGGASGNFPHDSPNAFHYTCLSITDTCSTVYYIYYNNYGNVDEEGTALYAIPLSDGKNVTETLDAMLSGSSNTISSKAKGESTITGDYVDSWFHNKSGINVNELDDVVWCNDRSIGGYHGWDKDTDNHTYNNKYLHFAAYKRLVEDDGRPTLECANAGDRFTVSPKNGNGKLTYPVALLTADELVMAGTNHDVATENYLVTPEKMQWTMTPYYFSDDNARMFTENSSGKLTESYTYSSEGIRPALALKSTFHIVSGDGTDTNPYKIEF